MSEVLPSPLPEEPIEAQVARWAEEFRVVADTALDDEYRRLISQEAIRFDRADAVKTITNYVAERYPMAHPETIGEDIARYVGTQDEAAPIDGQSIMDGEIIRIIGQIGGDMRAVRDRDEISRRKYALAARLYALYGDELGGRLVPYIDAASEATDMIEVANLEPAAVQMMDIAENGIPMASRERYEEVLNEMIEQLQPQLNDAVMRVVGMSDAGNDEIINFIVLLGGSSALHESMMRYDPMSTITDKMNEEFYDKFDQYLSGYEAVLARRGTKDEQALALCQIIHDVYDVAMVNLAEVMTAETQR